MPFGEFVFRLGAGGSDGTADMRTLFYEYVAVGGIPEAVDAWSKKRDIASVDEVLSGILDDLMDSITDERGETFSAKCMGILRSIPRQLSGPVPRSRSRYSRRDRGRVRSCSARTQD